MKVGQQLARAGARVGPLGPPLQPGAVSPQETGATEGRCPQRRRPAVVQSTLTRPPLAHREKACLVDEDSRSSAGTLPGPGAPLPPLAQV